MTKSQRRRKFIAEHPDHPTAWVGNGNSRWRYLLAEDSQWRQRRRMMGAWAPSAEWEMGERV